MDDAFEVISSQAVMSESARDSALSAFSTELAGQDSMVTATTIQTLFLHALIWPCALGGGELVGMFSPRQPATDPL
jgi:hypothetical protein